MVSEEKSTDVKSLTNDEDFPSEISEKLANFHLILQEIESNLQISFDITKSENDSEFEPLDRAKLHLISAYALNALFWMYLNIKGENPQENGVKQELERIRSYMTKVKEISDRSKAPRLNVPAAKRFLQHSLWTPESKRQKQQESDTSDDDKEAEKQNVMTDQRQIKDASATITKKSTKKRKRRKNKGASEKRSSI